MYTPNNTFASESLKEIIYLRKRNLLVPSAFSENAIHISHEMSAAGNLLLGLQIKKFYPPFIFLAYLIIKITFLVSHCVHYTPL